MTAKPLRVVEPDEKPSRRPKQTVAQAAATGDQLATLIATRDRVAVAISDERCSPRDLAALTKRLDDIIEKIHKLQAQRDEGEAGDDHDEAATGDRFDASAI